MIRIEILNARVHIIDLLIARSKEQNYAISMLTAALCN